MNQYITSLKQHPAWPELAAYAKTKHGLHDLSDVTEVELLGVMWAFVAHNQPKTANGMLNHIEFTLDAIMFSNSAGN